jgi:magnesium transporter
MSFQRHCSCLPSNFNIPYFYTSRPSVNAMYYVVFTTCTLSASFILYGGFNTTEVVTTLSLVCGFLLNFFGIALLTLSKTDDQAGDYTLGGTSPIEMQISGYVRVSTTRRLETSRESEDGYRNRRSVNIR